MTKLARPPILSTDKPTSIRPTILLSAMVDSSVAAAAAVIPLSIPWGTMCTGIVVSEEKWKNCMVHSNQSCGVARACAKANPVDSALA